MRDWYDGPRVEELPDEQAQRIPQGALGRLDPVQMAVDGMPTEVASLWRAYMEDRISTSEFAMKAADVKATTPYLGV